MALLLVLSTGCQDLENNSKLGTLVVKLTDAPFPIEMIDSAMVTITKVEIRKKSEGEELGNPYITVMDEDRSFNLLELRNGVSAVLVELDIEPGNYDLVRLYVDEASISVKDHDTYNMKVPSGSQTGIKIFIKPEIHVAGGLSTELLLDFNVEKSFLLQGNMKSPAGIKGFHFKPVIRAVNNTTAGIIEGVVDYEDSLLADVYVWIAQDTMVTSAFTDTLAYYAMPGIPAGFYSVSAGKEGFDTVTVEGVEIVEGNLTVQNFTLVPSEEE